MFAVLCDCKNFCYHPSFFLHGCVKVDVMHVPTLMLLNITMSVVICITLAMTALRSHRELTLLAAALGTHALGYALLGLRGQIDDVFSIVVGNAAIATALSLLAESVYHFQRRTGPRFLIWTPVVLVVLSYSWFINDFQTRVLLGGVSASTQLLIALIPLISRHAVTAGRGQYVVITGFIVALLAMIARVYYLPASAGAGSDALFDPSSGYSQVFFASLVALLLVAMGLIHMVQERTQYELHDSEKHYRQLIEMAQEGVVVLAQRCVRLANQKTAELLGVAQDQLIGKEFIDYIGPEQRAFALQRYRMRLDGEAENEAYDLPLVTAHAGERWFRISGVRIQWHGEPATLTFISDIHDRKIREQEAHQLAYVDPLTQLPNRRLLEDRISVALAQSARSHAHLALLFIDLDKLKLLNDSRGHKAGDFLLVESAQRLRGNVREGDTAARLGGDEFVVLLHSLDQDYGRACVQAKGVAEKIMRALKAPYFLPVNDEAVAQTEVHEGSGSMGIHVFKGPADNIEELLAKADAAMYRAKQTGPGLIHVAGYFPT